MDANKSRQKAVLLLEDGSLFEGEAIGKIGTTGGEICFNTGMTGYQEIYTDPSYFGQIIVNTTSHIGNYGTIDSEQESDHPQIKGLVVNSFSNDYSRNIAHQSLDEYLEKHGVVGICGIDTRKIVRYIRNKGAMNAVISSELTKVEDLTGRVKEVPSMDGLELASQVSTEKPYLIGDEKSELKVAVLDLGVKKSILKNLVQRGCYLKVFPAQTSYEDMEAWEPNGYFISNGPGDPAPISYAVETVTKALDDNRPIFGICLGHQILALANGISTYKMHHGHRGLNHPVKNILTGRCEVTSQNHGFGVIAKEISDSTKVEITHVNLNDQTIEGIKVKGKNAFSVQYHPEASPGPHDSRYLFDEFIALVKASMSKEKIA